MENSLPLGIVNKPDLPPVLPIGEVLKLIQELKDYTRESHCVLGFDERTPEEFLNIFLDKTK